MVQELQWLTEPRSADHLPDVLWLRILALLPERDQAQARRVCRRLHRNGTRLRERGTTRRPILLSAQLSACSLLLCMAVVHTRTSC